MWKNLDADYLGLVHYRRHFKEKGTGKSFRNVLTGKKLDEILDKHSLLLPKKGITLSRRTEANIFMRTIKRD